MGRRWTERDIENLRRMAPRFSAPLIAEIIDRTVGAVAFKAQQLKLDLPTRHGLKSARKTEMRSRHDS